MAEVVSIFAGIISMANLLYQMKRSRDQSRTKVIDSFESELKDFVYNVLGWYNQIISFSSPLLVDIELGRLSAKKQEEYFKLLNTIKRSDVYYSKCQQFIDERLKYYEREPILNSLQGEASIQQLASSYRQFSKLVFNHKDRIGYLLWRWKSIRGSDRKQEVHKIEDDLRKIEDYKNAVSSVLNIELKR